MAAGRTLLQRPNTPGAEVRAWHSEVDGAVLSFHAHAGPVAIAGAVVGEMLDRLIPIAQPQRDHFDLVEYVRLLGRDSLVECVSQVGDERVERGAQVVDLISRAFVACLTADETDADAIAARPMTAARSGGSDDNAMIAVAAVAAQDR